MARLTPKELQEAKKRKQAEREEADKEAEERVAEKKERLAYLEEHQPQWELLDSVLMGQYDEIDKLAKKAPADEITELALRRVNEVIKEAKELLAGDAFIDSLDIFVSAGENPEYRDVLLVLREIRQGMQRQSAEHSALRRSVY